jgi:uncharacterized protein YyaL (SSP411 family)
MESILRKLFTGRYGTVEAARPFPPARNNQEAKTGNWPGRIPAVTDTKMIVAWNSLTISGLARAAVVFQQPKFLELAVRAANFILDQQWVDRQFHRLNYAGAPAVLAQSEDYAFFIKALLDLYQATLTAATDLPVRAGLTNRRTDNQTDRQNPPLPAPLSSHFLKQAIAVQHEFDRSFWSAELGGYYNTARNAERDLIVRERSYADNATPAANGVAIANLVRLALLTENLQYLDRAERGLQAFSSVMSRTPQACPSLFTALDWYLYCTLIQTSEHHLADLMTQYLPTSVFALATDLPTGSVGLVCQGLTCLSPARSWNELWEQVRGEGVRG